MSICGNKSLPEQICWWCLRQAVKLNRSLPPSKMHTPTHPTHRTIMFTKFYSTCTTLSYEADITESATQCGVNMEPDVCCPPNLLNLLLTAMIQIVEAFITEDRHLFILHSQYHDVMLWHVNIGSGNGLLPDGTKPLPEPMLTFCGIHLTVNSQHFSLFCVTSVYDMILKLLLHFLGSNELNDSSFVFFRNGINYQNSRRHLHCSEITAYALYGLIPIFCRFISQFWSGVGGAVRFLVVGTIGQEERPALDGAVFDIPQILAYLVHNMSRSQLYLGFGHFGWLSSFFGQ